MITHESGMPARKLFVFCIFVGTEIMGDAGSPGSAKIGPSVVTCLFISVVQITNLICATLEKIKCGLESCVLKMG
jgi:hypothetical protein